MSDRLLVLLRHGQSEWNLKNLFTGWKDPDLTDKGREEAREAGRKLKAQGFAFDVAFTSALTRAQHTLDLALKELGQSGVPIHRNLALNERDYGDLSGLNKDDARKKWGEEQVHVWRRSYDVPPPGGESLKDTLARTLPYFVQEILPCVLRGERTLVVAHGNSLRALIMVLDRLSPEGILKRELNTGVPVIYRLNADATVASAGTSGARTGRWTRKVEPCPKALSTSMRPRCIATRRCVRARPRPVPSGFSPSRGSICSNSRNRRGRSCSRMPTPVSVTSMTSSASTHRAESVTVPCGGVNLMAFESRL